jgi:hypothetical protein
MEWWSGGVVGLTVCNIAFLDDQAVDPIARLLLALETFI